MSIHLLIHDLLYSFSFLLAFSIGLVVFFKAKKDTARITLFLTFLGVSIFIASHVLGVSVANSELSRRILMFNLIDIFLPIFTAHCVFAFIGRLKEQKKVLILFYTIGIGLLIFFIVKPYYFLLTSVPKMYFPNYYVPGPYYFLMLIFFFSVAAYFLLLMRKVYAVSNEIEKNRIKYFAIALFLGYSVGSIDFLLIYNISFDPLWGFLFVPLFTIPFTYAALQYDLMDIKIVAKKTFVYTSICAIIGLVLVFLNYANNLIIKSSPGFPNWVSSFISAVIITVAIILVWKKIREEDVLKYEFINVITHKFRTPLTAIKWSGQVLQEGVPENLKETVGHVQKSTDSLVNLTNLLVNLSIADEASFEDSFVKTNLADLIEKLLSESSEEIKIKNLVLSTSFNLSNSFVLADEQKLKFVFQTLIDNAVNYNNLGGKISVDISNIDGENAVVKIIDSGIGINKDELKLVFTKFYRTESGKKADTEGMGIGLYLAKKIIERHNGKIWAESEGEGKGSSFFVSLPIVG